MKRRIANYTNSQGEQFSVCLPPDEFRGRGLLIVIHDDPPPKGTNNFAPMLLDSAMWEWLQARVQENAHEFAGSPSADKTDHATQDWSQS